MFADVLLSVNFAVETRVSAGSTTCRYLEDFDTLLRDNRSICGTNTTQHLRRALPIYSPIHKYDAVPHLEEWKKRGWGRITDAAKSGPVGGNPFNVEFTAIDYESWVPKGPAY